MVCTSSCTIYHYGVSLNYGIRNGHAKYWCKQDYRCGCVHTLFSLPIIADQVTSGELIFSRFIKYKYFNFSVTVKFTTRVPVPFEILISYSRFAFKDIINNKNSQIARLGITIYMYNITDNCVRRHGYTRITFL